MSASSEAQIEILEEATISPALDESIRAGLCVCFPKDREYFRLHRDWHGSRPAFSAAALEGGRVVAHVGIVDRVIRVGGAPVPSGAAKAGAGGQSVRVAGVQNVFVLPHRRGRGLVDRVMSAAMASAGEGRRGLDCGLLFCVPDLEKVYARTGWRRLSPRGFTRVDGEGRRRPLPEGNIAMWLPLRRGEFPEGDVDLGGNDW